MEIKSLGLPTPLPTQRAALHAEQSRVRGFHRGGAKPGVGTETVASKPGGEEKWRYRGEAKRKDMSGLESQRLHSAEEADCRAKRLTRAGMEA